MVYETWTLGKNGAEDLLATDGRRNVAIAHLAERAGRRDVDVLAVLYTRDALSFYTAARCRNGIVTVCEPVPLA